MSDAITHEDLEKMKNEIVKSFKESISAVEGKTKKCFTCKEVWDCEVDFSCAFDCTRQFDCMKKVAV